MEGHGSDSNETGDVNNKAPRNILPNVETSEKPKAENNEALLKKLLEDFDMSFLYSNLNDVGITFRSLKFLNEEDIAEAIPKIGIRAEFRHKLFLWRKERYGSDDDNLIVFGKVQEWLHKCENEIPSSPNLPSSTEDFMEKQDFYHTPRQKKKNPRKKMYSGDLNSRAKKRKDQ